MRSTSTEFSSRAIPNTMMEKPIRQAPGHQEPELALVKLYRVTGKDLYLDMARKFLEIRGVTYVPDGEGVMSPTYAQQHKPVSEQSEAVGHAVRATYQYSAMADVSALTGKKEYAARAGSHLGGHHEHSHAHHGRTGCGAWELRASARNTNCRMLMPSTRRVLQWEMSFLITACFFSTKTLVILMSRKLPC